MIAFTVPGTAVPGGSKRPVLAGNGRLRTVDSSGARGRDWRATVADVAFQHMRDREILDGALDVRMEFVVARPAGHYRTGRNAGQLRPGAPEHPVVRPDVLKLARLAEDAMTGVCWRDDSQTVRLIASKRYATVLESPALHVRIRHLPTEDTP